MEHAESVLRAEKSIRYFSTSPRVVRFTFDPTSFRVLRVIGDPEELLGFPSHAWLADGFWLSRVHPADREEALKFCRTAASEGRRHEMIYRWIDAQDDVVWVHVVIAASDGEPGATVWQATAIDVTRQAARLSEAEAVQTDKVRDLVGSLIRELNEVSRAGDMLARHLSAQSDDVGSDHALSVRGGLQRLRALLEAQVEQENDAESLLGHHHETARMLMRRIAEE